MIIGVLFPYYTPQLRPNSAPQNDQVHLQVYPAKRSQVENGTYPLLLQAFLGGTRVRIRLDIYLKPAEWNDEKQFCRIPTNREQEMRVNSLLAKHKSRVEELFFEARMSATPLSATAFLEEFENKPALDLFAKFVEGEIEKERSDKEPSTVKQYVSMLKHLVDYQPNASFADISFEYVQGFDRYMRKKGIGDNSRAKYHTLVRKFILLAQKKKRRVPNPYEIFKVRSVAVERTWLDVKEVDALAKLYMSKTLGVQLQDALRQFLFSV